MNVKKKICECNKRRGELKRLLRATDYIAIKFAEGELTVSEYASYKEQRRVWRAEINALETEINLLKGSK